jgi:hypothetical protein
MVVAMTLSESVEGHNKFAWMAGFAAALFVQFFTGLWWASGQAAKLQTIDERLAEVKRDAAIGAAEAVTRADRLARLEEHVIELTRANGKIEEHLTAIETYLHDGSRQDDPGRSRRRN